MTVSLRRQKRCECKLLKYQVKHLLMNTLGLFNFRYTRSENPRCSDLPLGKGPSKNG